MKNLKGWGLYIFLGICLAMGVVLSLTFYRIDWNVPFPVTALLLGITTSVNCCMICGPILVSYILIEDTTPRKALNTSVIFSLGRLFILMFYGIIFYYIGIKVIEFEYIWILKILLALGIVVYGWMVSQDIKSSSFCMKRSSRSVFSILLGIFIGLSVCPALWIVVFRSALMSNVASMMLTLFLFWIGTSAFMVIIGVMSGGLGGSLISKFQEKFGPRQVKVVCGGLLMVIGIIYLVRIIFAFTGE